MRSSVVVTFGLVLAGVVACTEILGVGGTHEPIGVAVCVCDDEALNRFGSNAAACQETVTNKLLRADAAVTTAWIAQYKALGCDNCNRLPACLRIAPLCASASEGCTTNADCCDGLGCDADGRCTACVGPDSACSGATPCCGVEYACDTASNLCKRCSPVTEACDDSRDCCGFGQIDVYCDKAGGGTKGVCASEEGCKHRGEPCDTDGECCGARFSIPNPADPASSIPAGSCEQDGANKQCVERCDPGNPDNCFGCCGSRYVRATQGNVEYVCSGDASCSPRSCVTLSGNGSGGGPSFEKTDCPAGERCTSVCGGFLCSNVCEPE